MLVRVQMGWPDAGIHNPPHLGGQFVVYRNLAPCQRGQQLRLAENMASQRRAHFVDAGADVAFVTMLSGEFPIRQTTVSAVCA